MAGEVVVVSRGGAGAAEEGVASDEGPMVLLTRAEAEAAVARRDEREREQREKRERFFRQSETT